MVGLFLIFRAFVQGEGSRVPVSARWACGQNFAFREPKSVPQCISAAGHLSLSVPLDKRKRLGITGPEKTAALWAAAWRLSITRSGLAGGGCAYRAMGLRTGAVGGGKSAECLVVDESLLGRMLTAYRAVWIFANLQNSHVVAVGQRVEIHNLADQRMARVEQHLDRFQRLDRSDQSRQRAQHSRLGARRRHVGRRRFGIEASIARSALRGVINGGLAFEAEDCAIDQRFLGEHAR